MKNAIQIRRLFVVIGAIAVAGMFFAGLGCEKGPGVAPLDESIGPRDVTMKESETEHLAKAVGPADITMEKDVGSGEGKESQACKGNVDNVVYVKAGEVEGDGTRDKPFGDINDAIALAKLTIPSEVHVAQGTYYVDSSKNTQIKMVEGVSLCGGYLEDFKERNPSKYITTIEDTSKDGENNVVIEAKGKEITATTMVDGFSLRGGGGGETYAVLCREGAGPTISNNNINGGGGLLGTGIYNIGSAPYISLNTINGGSGSERNSGISNIQKSSPIIINNTINGGVGSKKTIGIIIDWESSATIINNTINGGYGSEASTGIEYKGEGDNSDSIGASIINNNIIFTSGNAYFRIGIKDKPGSMLQELRNNDIFGCSLCVYFPTSWTNPTEHIDLESFFQGLNIPADGNISMPAEFVDQAGGNWHLTGKSPIEVTEGGLNGGALGWGFTTDKDGNTRTPQWSIGAYEYDKISLPRIPIEKIPKPPQLEEVPKIQGPRPVEIKKPEKTPIRVPK